MKKIMLVILLLLCGCNKTEVNIPEINEIESPKTRQQVLKEQARFVYSDFIKNKPTDLVSYSTPLRAIFETIEEKTLFQNCNLDTTGFNYNIFKIGNKLQYSYEIIIDCEGTNTIYYYDDLSDESEPIDIYVVE